MTAVHDQKPKVMLVCKWCPPDQAPIGYMIRDIGEFLKECGWEVTLLTDLHHPYFFSKITKRWTSIVLKKIGNHLAFSIYSFYKIMMSQRHDIIYAVAQPITQFIILVLAAKLKRSKLIFNIQDLHPDALFQLGLVQNAFLRIILRKIEYFGYRHADGLIVLSDGFAEHCSLRGAPYNMIRVIPNWINLDEIYPSAASEQYAISLGLPSTGKLILYAGSLSLAAGLETLMYAAQEIARRKLDMTILIIGEGAAKKDTMQLASELDLHNVKFLPFQPRENLNSVQALSDLSLVTMREGQGRNSVPSKIYGYMSAGKPIIASVDLNSETARIMREAKCGWVAPPSDYNRLADAIEEAASSPELAKKYGRNGRHYLERNNSQSIILNKYKYALEEHL